MTEALQPSLSSYLSLDLPPLPLEGVLLFPPEPLLLFLESQAPGELRDTLVLCLSQSQVDVSQSVSVCLCRVLWVSVASVIRLNDLPETAEVNSFAKEVLPFKESAQSPQTHLSTPCRRRASVALIRFWKEGDGGSLRSHLDPLYLDPLLKNSTGLELGS